MPNINTLIADFFVNIGDPVHAASSPDDPDVAVTSANVPRTDSGIRVKHLIDGVNYFGELRREIAGLLAGGTDRFFYTNCWTLGTSPTPDMVPIGEGTLTSAWGDIAKKFVANEPAFQLEDDSAGPFHSFQDDVRAMSGAGVDVRFLVWASPFLVNFESAARAGGNYTMQYWAVNVHSLRSILDLRKLPNMYNKIVVNTLAHTLASMHLKMVVCGDNTGFRGYVGGIDFTHIRNAKPTHQDIPGRYNGWHDVAVKVEGTAANSLYVCFSELWDEQVQKSAKVFKAFGEKIQSHFDDTPLTPDRQTLPITGGTSHTQVLETLPTMNFSSFKTDRAPLRCYQRILASFKQRKLSFAENGRFEFRSAQRKAVMAARQYIYIEDQVMENIELARWINAQMLQVPGLKLILLFGGDPLDPPPPDMPEMMDILTRGLTTPEDRIVFVKASHTIHAKVTIIDDLWASIGSSNSWVRSFYMDGEINVSVLDDADPADLPFAAQLRKDLWGEHCGKQPGPACDPLLSLTNALGIWTPEWGMPPFNFQLREGLEPKTIPFVYVPCPPLPAPCPLLSANPEGMRGNEPPAPPKPPPPSQDDRERKQGADSRLEY